MKKFFLLSALFWLTSLSFVQPVFSQNSFAGIHYQTVVRDSEGLPLQNTSLALQLSIRTGAPDGEAVYAETHAATTNQFGLVNLVIGQGTPVTGEFANINWSAAPHFLETAIDATGSGQFQVMGVTQFLSVPYALSSSNGVPGGSNPGDMLYWNGSQWIQVPAGQNGQVLTFSNGVPVWGGVQLPILNTSAVTNITAFTAYCGGTIANDGGSPVNTRGICWNTSSAPTTSDFKITAGSGSGNFLAQMTGLESSTQYFVRAFATNSAGTSYGQEMTFYTTAGNITLSTTAMSNITTTTAQSGGNITLNGGSPVTARGVCWNTAPYPTIAHNKTTDGSGNGAYTSNLTGLAPNTQYYIRAYATNGLGTSYGNQLTFTTLSGIVTLTTAAVTNITNNSATCGGEITSDGGSPVTARGVCWSTTQNPTIADFKTTDGEGTGAFVSNLTGLLEDTTYFVRAYATNEFGTYYGNELSFETPAWECGNSIVDSRDGQSYNTVQIGEQCWMAENLNVGVMINSLDDQSDNEIIEKYCYNDYEANCNTYGGLYQWNEMLKYSNIQGEQGICPLNWHLPIDSEWCILEQYVDFTIDCNSTGWRGTDGGGKLKEVGTNVWGFPNLGATNSSGFTGLPGGILNDNQSFMFNGFYGYWWTSTRYDLSNSWYRFVGYDESRIKRENVNNQNSFSIRCIFGQSAQNLPPNKCTEPIPNNGSSNIPINSNISWYCSDPDSDILTFDIYFGASDPPVQVATGITTFFFNPGTLAYYTTYYWKVVAHDDHGNINEGDVWSFISIPPSIGNVYGGGKVAYILQPGDPEYVEGEVHGIVAATSDLNPEYWGCEGIDIPGADGYSIGTGYQNTIDIVSGCSTPDIAARVCYNLTLNGFSDWYLPSIDELGKLYLKKNTIGGFISAYYWSSTEQSALKAWAKHFSSGTQSPEFKQQSLGVQTRAIRKF